MAWKPGAVDPETGLTQWTNASTGEQRWGGSDGTVLDGETSTNLNASQGPAFGSPWSGDRTGWAGANADALFDRYARSEAGAVGAETLAGLRSKGVSDDAAVEALWKSATESANPNWAGGSPTGIKRGIWGNAGVLDKLDAPELRAAQGREDQEIWAGQQKNGDDGFGGLMGLAMLAAAIYTGGTALGAWGAEGAILGAGEGALSTAEFAANAGVGQAALEGSSLTSTIAKQFTPEKLAQRAVSTAVQQAVAPDQPGLIQSPYGYDARAVTQAAAPRGPNTVPVSFATAIPGFQNLSGLSR